MRLRKHCELFEHKCKLMKAKSIAEANKKKDKTKSAVFYSPGCWRQSWTFSVEHLPPHPVHPRPDRCLQPPPQQQQHTGSQCFREDLRNPVVPPNPAGSSHSPSNYYSDPTDMSVPVNLKSPVHLPLTAHWPLIGDYEDKFCLYSFLSTSFDNCDSTNKRKKVQQLQHST